LKIRLFLAESASCGAETMTAINVCRTTQTEQGAETITGPKDRKQDQDGGNYIARNFTNRTFHQVQLLSGSDEGGQYGLGMWRAYGI
jgi:hypothetical protein